MEYYGNNDWRDYLRRQNDLAHFGIPKRSGRYPWGSGENPYHHGSDAPGRRKRKIAKAVALKLGKSKSPTVRGVGQYIHEHTNLDAMEDQDGMDVSLRGLIRAERNKVMREKSLTQAEREYRSLSHEQQKAYDMVNQFNEGKRDFSDEDYKSLQETGRLIRQKTNITGAKPSAIELSLEKHIGEVIKEGEERTGIIRTNETYISNLKDAGFKIEKTAYGTEAIKDIKARNAKGDNIDLNIRIDGQIYDDRFGGSVKIPSNELKGVLKDVEQNWSSYDKAAREHAVKVAFEGNWKPWGYDDSDATPELSKLSVEEQKKDYYNRLGKDFWTNGAKESPVYLNVYVGGDDNGSSYLGEVWYDNGGVWGDHSVTVDIDLKRKKAGNVSIQG